MIQKIILFGLCLIFIPSCLNSNYYDQPDGDLKKIAKWNIEDGQLGQATIFDWYFFVIQDKPTTSYEKDKKILFFYQFKELLLLRTEIRSAIR